MPLDLEYGESRNASAVSRVAGDCSHHYLAGLRSRRGAREARRHVGLKPMRFVSLHHHTTFSYLDGFGMPEAHVRRAGELNMAQLAFTEHGNTASHVKAEHAALRAGIKPIFGCELYTGVVGEGASQAKYHLTALAMTPLGYRNLMTLVSRSYSEGYYYAPTCSWEMLLELGADIIFLSGCQGSLLFCSAVGGKLISPGDASLQRALAVARRFKRAFGDRYYIELQAFPELEPTRRANPLLAEVGARAGIPLVATMDCHYTAPEEAELQQVLHNVRGGEKQSLEEQVRSWGYDVPLCPPTTDKSVFTRLLGTGLTRQQALEAIANTELIAGRCRVELPKLPLLRYPINGVPAAELFARQLQAGWATRGLDRLAGAERASYAARLRREADLIAEKDFIDYFLVVGDLVRHAKQQGIYVGPARGSAAASLVCWLLQITEVNPMLYPNLVFERFIDVSRSDLPDIDLDFESERRGELYQYLANKYGPAQVANIGTFTYYRAKNSLDDVGRVHRVPAYDVEKVKSRLLERSSGDLRASATIEDTAEQFEDVREVFLRWPALSQAFEFEGNVKGQSVHSAGLVVSSGPLREIAPVYTRTVAGEKREVIAIDKYDAERQGMLKIDVLGLSTMSMLADCCRMIGWGPEQLYQIPLDDPEVIAGFRRNDVNGIFQFDGRAMRSVNGGLAPDSFSEVCDVNALSRPGPLHNGSAVEYIEIKHGKRRPELLHPLYDEITRPTHYLLVYQEQILRCVTEIGGFDWTAASYIRKIMTKKMGEQEFDRHGGQFVAGAAERGLDEKLARHIWRKCITAGGYAFNAAHCVSYGMLAWWCMYFKVHHGEAFYAASLKHTATAVDAKHGINKPQDMLRDALEHGVTAAALDLARSEVGWSVHDGQLLPGFSQVPGIGEKVAQAICDGRLEGWGWPDLTKIKGIGKVTADRVAAWAEHPDPFDVLSLPRRLNELRAGLRTGEFGALPMPTHTSIEVPFERGLPMDVVWCGVIQHRNLRDLFEEHASRGAEHLDPAKVKAPHLRESCVLLGRDETEQLSITFNRWRYPAVKAALWDIQLGKDLVLITGQKTHYNHRQIIGQSIWVFSD